MGGKHLVFQTDFGLSDGAVCAMYGVAMTVDPELRIFDLTHDIPPFNIWEGSYRLYQTISYWPEETVFVSVVDPGVGSERLSIVVKTVGNRYIVTPDNGTLTHIKHHIGIAEARIINESINRLPHSRESYTFHGRDVYAFTGARLASHVISFEEVGHKIDVDKIIDLPFCEPSLENGMIKGTIDILDVRFGNLWTNISRELFDQAHITYGDSLEVLITNNDNPVFQSMVEFGRFFSDTEVGKPLLYVNSIGSIGLAINQRSFANEYQIGTGTDWSIEIRKR